MPVTKPVQGRHLVQLIVLATAVASILAVTGALDQIFAQGVPFGAGPGPSRAPRPDGIVGWIIAKQNEFYLAFAGAIRAAKADGTAVFSLLGVSFFYGIFHAAGPGHGKAVISSYLVANQETWRRGIILSFVSAMLQALVAVTIVGVGAVILNWTSARLCKTEIYVEKLSYLLIAIFGLYLLWVKGRGFLSTLRVTRHEPAPAPLSASATSGHSDHGHHDRHDHSHSDGHSPHDEDGHCGHSHGPDLKDIAGPGGWQRGLSAIISVGLRPCSGAIIVLGVASTQGLFWAGVLAAFVMGFGTAITVAVIATVTVVARSLAGKFAVKQGRGGSLALHAVEVAAAALIVAFGSLLFIGAMANEQMTFLCNT